MEFHCSHLALFLAVFFGTFLLTSNADTMDPPSPAHRAFPVLWAPTNLRPVKKFVKVSFVTYLFNPCTLVKSPDNLALCTAQFERITALVVKNSEPLSKADAFRAKREVATIIVGAILLNIAAWGFYVWRVEIALANLKKRTDIMEEMLRKNEEAWARSRESQLLDRLEQTERDFMDFFARAAHGQVSPQFQKVFTVNSTTSYDHAESWKVAGVYFDEGNKMLVAQITIPVQNDRQRIYKAVPFTIYTFADYGKTICRYKYTFDKFMVHDFEHKCTKRLLRQPEGLDDSLTFTPFDVSDRCENNFSPGTHFERQSCKPTALGYNASHVQLKELGNKFYVYCYGGQIELNGVKQRCISNNVFVVSDSTKITADQREVELQKETIYTGNEIDSAVSKLISERIFEDSEKDFKELDKLAAEADKRAGVLGFFYSIVFDFFGLPLSVGLVVLVIVLVVGFCIKKCLFY